MARIELLEQAICPTCKGSTFQVKVTLEGLELICSNCQTEIKLHPKYRIKYWDIIEYPKGGENEVETSSLNEDKEKE